jgi:ferredoxin-NADP reductase
VQLPINNKIKIAKNTWEIRFGLITSSREKEFKFKPGQYVKVTLPEIGLNHPKGNLREFSIISASENELTIAFRESDSDFKQALLSHAVGDLIKVDGPFGDYFLPKKLPESIVMIAGGMGITPFFSMLEYLAEQKSPTKVLLIYVNSKSETTVYLDKLDVFKGDNFDFELQQGRLTKKALNSHIRSITYNLIPTFARRQASLTTYYISGPLTMVRDTRINLIEIGINPKLVLTEEFTGY